jgi:hypothetical protein
MNTPNGGTQPLKSQAHQVRSEGRSNDEAGEQVAVQLAETLHAEMPRREETDHLNLPMAKARGF